MKYRKLGKTGLLVSEIGFGTIPILSGDVPVLPSYYSPDEETAAAVMKCAFDLGCNLFDTAIVPEYGDAEIKLGHFAAQTERSKLVISDKSRCYSGNDMYQAVLTSCDNLGTYADLYFVHQVDAEHEDLVFEPYGALAALTELKAEGRIRYAGLASHYYDILLRGARDSRVDVLQGSGNIFERGMLDRIEEELEFRNKGFLVNKVYAAGILPSYFSAASLIDGVLSYDVSSALIGIGTVEQAVTAMTEPGKGYVRPPFSAVCSVLNKSFEVINCDRCQRCSCVYGTEIHTLFRQYHYYHMGKDYWALRKLDMGIRESAAACRSCTGQPCRKQCPKGIRIPEEIQKIEALVQIHIRKGIVH